MASKSFCKGITDHGHICMKPLRRDNKSGYCTAHRKQSESFEDDHIELAEMLTASPAASMVCGYRSDLYDRLYSDWTLHEKPISNNYHPVEGENSHLENRVCVGEKECSRCPLIF